MEKKGEPKIMKQKVEKKNLKSCPSITPRKTLYKYPEKE